MPHRVKSAFSIIVLLLATGYPARADQLDGLKGLVPLAVSGICFFLLVFTSPLVLSLPNSSHWFARTILFILAAIDLTAGIMSLYSMIEVAPLILPFWNILSFALSGGLTALGAYALYRVVRKKLK